jgi:hypothetical protein
MWRKFGKRRIVSGWAGEARGESRFGLPPLRRQRLFERPAVVSAEV